MKGHSISTRLVALALASTLAWAVPAVAGTFPVANRKDLGPLELRVRAAHFLSHGTFGPTPAEIDALAERMGQIGSKTALEEWIDEQFALPATHHHAMALQMIADDGFAPLDPGIVANRYKHHAWWHVVLTAPDQLRQRMAWALAQIFVINEYRAGFGSQVNDASGQPQYLGVANYYDMLVDDAFSNYHDVLEDVTLHPIMGVFLSHAKNPKGDPSIGRFPDENYAREMMQLFSIGLYVLNSNGVFKRDGRGEQIETYDNETIKAFARVFTGLSFAGSSSFNGAPQNFHQPMVMHEDYHDTDEKVLLGGTVLPAGQTGMQDIGAALNNLFQHPNVGPFIGRLLIQRLVKSNPSKHYIRRVAKAFADNGSGIRGDFQAVLKAILLDKEALDTQSYAAVRKPLGLQVVANGTEHSRLREPVLRYSALVRAFNASSDYATGRFMIPPLDGALNQAAYRARHVLNFYLPDYRPPGDLLIYEPSKRIPNGALFAPEFEIFTSVIANRLANRLRADLRDERALFSLVNNSTVGEIQASVLFDFSKETALAADPNQLLTHLDLLLCHGTLGEGTKDAIASVVNEETTNTTLRARGAILAVATSPECAVGN
jgi:uncharacterized protein (DUF1800 family)